MFDDGKISIINVLESMDEFFTSVSARVDKDVRIANLREPIDFDHPLFYVFLGAGVGCSSVEFVSTLIGFDQATLVFTYYIISTIVFSTGVYFWIKQPISMIHGKRYRYADLLTGILFLCASFWVYLSSRVLE